MLAVFTEACDGFYETFVTELLLSLDAKLRAPDFIVSKLCFP